MNYYVWYARIVADRESVELLEVCYGGLAESASEADGIARECANTRSIRGAIHLPKVMTIEDGNAIDAGYEACEHFERLVQNMNESAAIITETTERQARRAERRLRAKAG